MDETWSSGDLPVLKAVVEIFKRAGGGTTIRTSEIEAFTGFDKEAVQRSLHALSREPGYFGTKAPWNGDILRVGPPNAKALRVAGQWPSPEGLLARLVTALEDAGDDGEEFRLEAGL